MKNQQFPMENQQFPMENQQFPMDNRYHNNSEKMIKWFQ